MAFLISMFLSFLSKLLASQLLNSILFVFQIIFQKLLLITGMLVSFWQITHIFPLIEQLASNI